MRRDTFGSRLARLRQAAGLTAYGLAKATGLDETGIRRLEAGERQPSLETARRLAEALGEPSLAVWDGCTAPERA